MMGMRLVFRNVSETSSDNSMFGGTSTMHAVKGVGCVKVPTRVRRISGSDKDVICSRADGTRTLSIELLIFQCSML